MRNDNIKRSVQAIYDGAGGGRGDHSVLHTFGCVDFANQTRLQTGEPLHDVGMALWLGWNGEGALVLRGFSARVYIERSEIYCATAVLILCCRDCVIAPVRDSASKRPGVVRPHPKSQFQIGA